MATPSVPTTQKHTKRSDRLSDILPRLPIVDAARGVALLAMFVYHMGWNLAYFGYLGDAVVTDPLWRGFAMAIAGSFLFLVGVSLVLATREGIRWRSFLIRLAVIVAAAGLITLVTYFLFPTSFIYFGILHSIAVSSVLGLLFLRAPLWLIALTAVAVFAAPFFLSHPYFNAFHWRWLGLMTYFPQTNDYEPILPWFSATLAGILTARLVLQRGWEHQFARWRGRSWPGRVLRFGGRNSLAVYLIHQPIFFGAVWLVFSVAPPAGTPLSVIDYPEFCQRNCATGGASEEFCESFCFCMNQELIMNGIMFDMLEGRLTEDQEIELGGIAQMCQSPGASPLLTPDVDPESPDLGASEEERGDPPSSPVPVEQAPLPNLGSE